jgi:hypothetical protein
MARYSKIHLGPARKNDPQVFEAEAGAAIMPGSLIVLSSGRFVLAGATTVGKVWLAQENYLAMKGVDAAYAAYAAGPPVVDGDRVLGLEMQDDVLYAARIANGVNITAVGTALTPAANGTLGIASTSDLVVAYADEIYNNNTGSTQLLRIRPAGSQSYLSAAS